MPPEDFSQSSEAARKAIDLPPFAKTVAKPNAPSPSQSAGNQLQFAQRKAASTAGESRVENTAKPLPKKSNPNPSPSNRPSTPRMNFSNRPPGNPGQPSKQPQGRPAGSLPPSTQNAARTGYGGRPPGGPGGPGRPPGRGGRPPQKMSLKQLLFVMSSGVLFAGLILISAAFLLYATHNEDEMPEGSGFSLLQPSFKLPTLVEDQIFLVMGVDSNGKQSESATMEDRFAGTRTDTIMLVRFTPRRSMASVVSVPRDSKVYYGDTMQVGKINGAHAIGGIPMARRTIEKSLGVPIDHVILIDYRGVRALVDALGGVDIYVEKKLRYHDYSANLHVNFDPGFHHMDGQNAEAYLRFRHDAMADIGRVRRQQYFLAAVVKKLKDPAILMQIPRLVEFATHYVRTDLSAEQMLRTAAFVRTLNMADIRTATLPGHASTQEAVSYWIIDPAPAQAILDRLVLNVRPHVEENSVDAEALRIGLVYDPLQAESVKQFVTELEAKQFKVLCQRQDPTSFSQIVEHRYTLPFKVTKQVRALHPNLREARIIFEPAGSTYNPITCDNRNDFTIILGKDWR